ncbi:LOW QUALITY PROTEIN: titin-like [Trichechus inunguis]
MRVSWFKDGKEIASSDKYRIAFVEGTASLEISRVDMNDAGNFTCRATNSVGSKDSSGALIVQEPPSFVTKPESKDVLPGSAVCLKSTFQGSTPLTIRWFKGDKELVSGGTCYITKYGLESSLELYPVKTSDSGTYTCKISNVAGSMECSANLFVKGPATFVEKLEPSQLLKKGDTTQLTCKVTGTPPIKITWFVNDREIKESSKHKMSFVESTAVLRLTDVAVQDSGEYMCEAQNEAGSDHCSSIIIVKESPYFTKEFKTVEVLKEYDVMLLGEVAGTPPFEITWFKDNMTLRSGRKYKTFIQDQLVSLQILKFVAADAGEYQCRVTNEVGSSTCSARVTLRDPPTFVKKIESTSSLRGGTAAFQATLKGSVPITVTWLKDNEEITEDDSIRMTFENNVASLYLSGIEVKHDGKYVCQAKNDAGIQRCSALLSVKEPATITDEAVSIDVTHGDPATLQVKFSGTKEITAKWFKDGQELTLGHKYRISVTDTVSVLKIISTEKKDSGEYTFEVQNDVGRSSCKASINVLDLIIPPSFTKKLKKMDSVKGSSIDLECIVAGSHPISIQWFKDDREISASEKYKFSFHDNTAFLEISHLEGTDSGTYTCSATNKLLFRSNINLPLPFCFVFYPEPPHFVEKPQSQDVNPNTRVQLKALVGGTAPMTIKWFKDNKELHSGAARSVWKDDTSTVLELFSAKAADSGTYICQLSNDVGTATSKATVFVKGLVSTSLHFLACLDFLGEERGAKKSILLIGLCFKMFNTFFSYSEPPQFIKKPSPVLVLRNGQSTSFECQITGTPEIKVSWYLDGNEITAIERHGISFTDGLATFHISGARVENSGTYVCEARNDAGTASCSIELKVKGSLSESAFHFGRAAW